MLNDIGTILHHNIMRGDKTYHKEYTPSSNPIDRRTRAGKCFNFIIVKNGPSYFDQYASVTPSQLGQVLLHSLVPGFTSLHPISGFEHVIKSFCKSVFVAITKLQWWGFLDTWWNVGTIPGNYPWWIIHEGGVASHLLGGYYDILYNCQSRMQVRVGQTNQHLPVLTMGKYSVGLWHNWCKIQQHPNAMMQSLLLWLIVITMGLFPMGTNTSAHFLPTNHRQIFYAFSKTSLLLSHSAYNTNTCSHMPMTQRDGKTVCWRNESTSRWIALQRKPWWQPTHRQVYQKCFLKWADLDLHGGGKGDGFPEVQAGGTLGWVHC